MRARFVIALLLSSTALQAHAQTVATALGSLPPTATVNPGDLTPITQNGVTRNAPVSVLVGSVAPLLSNNGADIPDPNAFMLNIGALPQGKAVVSGSVNSNGALTFLTQDGTRVPISGAIQSLPGPAGSQGPSGPQGPPGPAGSSLSVPSSCIIGGNGSALYQVSLGSGLTCSNGTLTATAPSLSVPSAPLLAGTGSALAPADATAVTSTLGYTPLKPANNLSDVGSPATVRSNLGLGALATQSAISLTGDTSGTYSNGSISTTLANVGTPGTAGDATHTVTVTTDAKGRVTASTPVAIAIPSSAVTDLSSRLSTALTPYAQSSSLGPLATQTPPVSSHLTGTDSAGHIVTTSVSQGDVTGALGFTPYAASNPSAFISAAGAPVQSVNGSAGAVSITAASLGAPLSSSLGPLATQSAVSSAKLVGTDTNGHIVASTLGNSDITAALGYTPYSSSNPAGYAPTNSPVFTGTPVVPGYLSTATASSTYAPANSPALTGAPTAPTPAASDNSGALATTAFVKSQGYSTSAGEHYVAPWDASANNPHLTSGSGTAGAYYIVQTAGTTTLDGNSTWAVGDHVEFSGTTNTWTRIQNVQAISSVAGKTGAVTLAVTDVAGAAPVASPTFTGTPVVPGYATTSSLNAVATQTVPVAAHLVGTDGTGKLTSAIVGQTDVTGALGYTPYNSTNPSNFIAASGAPVQSVNGSTGAISITASSLGAALASSLGPIATQSAVPSAHLTGTNSSGQIVSASVSNGDVTGALGYTPYSATNPSGFINAAGAPVQSINGSTGAVTVSAASLGAALSSSLGPLATQSAVTSTHLVGTNSSGQIVASAVIPSDLPVATASAIGGVKPDGTTIANNNGAISVNVGSGGVASYSDARIVGAVQSSAVGAANGIAPLNGSGKVAGTYLNPASTSATGAAAFPATGLVVDSNGNVQTNNQVYYGTLDTAMRALPIVPGVAGTYWNNSGTVTQVPGTYITGSTSDPVQLFLLAQLGGLPTTPGAAGTYWWNNGTLAKSAGSYAVPTAAATGQDLNTALQFVGSVQGAAGSLHTNGGFVESVPGGGANVTNVTNNYTTNSTTASTKIASGPVAQRPAATGSGNTYLATDAGITVTYQDTAAGTWTQIGAASNIAATALPITTAGKYYTSTTAAGQTSSVSANSTGGPQLYDPALAAIAGSNIGNGTGGNPGSGVLGGTSSGNKVVSTNETSSPTTGNCAVWLAGGILGDQACPSGGGSGSGGTDATYTGTLTSSGTLVVTAMRLTMAVYSVSASPAQLTDTNTAHRKYTLTANITLTLPSNPSAGRIFFIKNANTSGGYSITIQNPSGTVIATVMPNQTVAVAYDSSNTVWDVW